jgi:hypothetical protein
MKAVPFGVKLVTPSLIVIDCCGKPLSVSVSDCAATIGALIATVVEV